MTLPQTLTFKPHLIHDEDHWLELMQTPLQDRQHYHKQDGQFSFGYVAGRMLGIPLVEEDYLNMLYDLSKEENVYILSEVLDKTITSDRFQATQEILQINQQEKGLSINRIIAFMTGKELVPRHPDPNFYRHIQYTLIDVLKFFEQTHPQGLTDPAFRRFFIDLIKWLWNHVEPWFGKANVYETMPKIVWYGDATESQLYFLYLFMRLGADVLIFHPEGKDEFAKLDPNHDMSFVHQYEKTMELKPFPTEHLVKRTTVAYHASKEIEHVLHHESSQLYKPWQFRSYTPTSITLKTTYDELFLLMKEQALIRPHFKVENGQVYIPALFAKVAGVSADRKEYWDRLKKITEDELAITIKQFPFTQQVKANYTYHYQQSLNKRGELDPEKMIESHYWQYGDLPHELQMGVATAIAKFCATPKLKKEGHETLEQLKVFLFKQATVIPDAFLKLLQKFDYPKKVPRIVLFNNENNGTLSRTDAALMMLMHHIGFDVVLYTPTAQSDIEKFVDSHFISTFLQENVEFDQEFIEQEQSVIKKLFKNFNRLSGG